MKLKKVVVSIISVSIILMMLPEKVFAIMPVYEYNPISVLISSAMEIASIILGIAYLILAVIYLIKTKDKRTIFQQMRTLIIWLIITTIIIIALRYFAPIVKEIGMTYGNKYPLNFH